MDVNGRKSCTGNSWHVNIRYFFIKDLVDKKTVKVMYCCTEEMLGDYYIKALQGELFRFFRSIIVGHVSIFDMFPDDPKIKERVERWNKFRDLINLNTYGNEPSKADENKRYKVNEDTNNDGAYVEERRGTREYGRQINIKDKNPRTSI